MNIKKIVKILSKVGVSLGLAGIMILGNTSVSAFAANDVTATDTVNESNIDSKISVDKTNDNTLKITTSTSEKGKLYYKYIIIKNSDNTLAYSKGYGKSNSINFEVEKSEDYTIYCKIKDSKGNVNTCSTKYEAEKKELKINYVGYNKLYQTPLFVNVPVELENDAEGNGVLKYRFVVLKDGKNVYTRGYNRNSTATWVPGDDGDYVIYYMVQDNAGNVVTKTRNITISSNELNTSIDNYNSSYVRSDIASGKEYADLFEQLLVEGEIDPPADSITFGINKDSEYGKKLCDYLLKCEKEDVLVPRVMNGKCFEVEFNNKNGELTVYAVSNDDRKYVVYPRDKADDIYTLAGYKGADVNVAKAIADTFSELIADDEIELPSDSITFDVNDDTEYGQKLSNCLLEHDYVPKAIDGKGFEIELDNNYNITVYAVCNDNSKYAVYPSDKAEGIYADR